MLSYINKSAIVLLLLLTTAQSWGQRDIPASYSLNAPISYVRTWDASLPDTASANFHIETPTNKARMTSQYLDGLGRVIQTVSKKGSLATDPINASSTLNAKDWVMTAEYDSFGREQFKYLSFPANDFNGNTSIRDGLFKHNPFEQQAVFYNDTNNENPIKGQGETYYYGRMAFEASPTNRAVFAYSSGNSWVGNSRGIETQYLVNAADDSVRIWTISSNLSTSSFYSAGELYKTIMIDERGYKTVEYKDKEDNIILKKVQLNATPGTAHMGWLCTYYVYDALNHLRFVLQPKAVEALLNSGSWTVSNTVRNELCFYYSYDYRDRTIVKKIPGAGEVYMVYDARDRLVMVQDSNMRANAKWLVNLYDELNRLIQTGLVSNSSIGSKSFTGHLSDARNSTSYPFDSNSVPSSGYEELTRTGFDTYDDVPSGAPAGTLATAYVNADNFITTYEASPYYAEQIAQSEQVRGMMTWTKTKVLNTTTYLYSTALYDKWARVIQTKTTNLTGGVDTLTMQYDFSGKLLRRHMVHSKGGSNAHRYYLLTKNSYDDLQRLIMISKRVTKDNNLGGTDKIIVKNYYNSLGQIQKKEIGNNPENIGAPLDSLVYDYNIRGWLLGINRDYAKSASSSTHYFGFDVGYNQTDIAPANGALIGSYAAAQYNGNIAGILWKSIGDGQVRKYDFTYDALNRLTDADFNQYNGSSFDRSAGLDFSLHSLSFDASGNIITLNQRGWKVGGSLTIDSLAYTYANNGISNRLLNVIDRANDTQTSLGDFRSSSQYMTTLGGTKTTAAADYSYDGNGNLVKDYNKDIVSYTGADGIEYNYLNLPQKITVQANGSANKGTIEYTYDAMGNKLKKIVTEGSLTTTTLYLFGTYVNDSLQFFSHEEGRIRYTEDSGHFSYDYFIKDHLGNIRMVLTEEHRTNAYPAATMEASDSTTENLFYANLSATRDNLPSGYPTDPYTVSNTKIARLNGSSSIQKIGPAIVLKVMAGDKFNLRVSDWYKLNGTTPSSPNPITDLASILASTVSAVTGAKASAGELSSSGILATGVSNFFGDQGYNSSRPKAYVNWIVFDEQFQYDSSSSGSEQVGSDNMLNIHQFADLPIHKNGYLYIYVSNETPNVNVFFDNLQVTHIRGPLLEETHYYPFGLTIAGISTKAAANSPNQKEFNGIEHTTDLGLNQYDAFYRTLDPQIGRFSQIDPKPEDSNSPFSAFNNNPILYSDILGDKPPRFTLKQLIEYASRSPLFRQLLSEAGINDENYEKLIIFQQNEWEAYTEMGGENRIVLDPGHSKKRTAIDLAHELTNRKNLKKFSDLTLDAITQKITNAEDYARKKIALEYEGVLNQYRVAKELGIKRLRENSSYGNKLMRQYTKGKISDEQLADKFDYSNLNQESVQLYITEGEKLLNLINLNNLKNGPPPPTPPIPPNQFNKFDSGGQIGPNGQINKKTSTS